MTRVLVCGDRHWVDYNKILEEVFKIKDIDVIIHGAARGADTIGGQVADCLGIPKEVYPAQWDKYGRGAGPIRNMQMMNEGRPDVLLAFHSDIFNSKGTKNMVEISLNNNVSVRIVE